VVVASAKGGTGKSTIAANLAAMLAREHASSVLLIDFALDFGDASLLLDLASGMSTARAARQVARAELDEFRESLGHHASGVFVLAAAQRFSERVPVEPHELDALLDLAVQSFDHIVIDTAAVFDDPLVIAMNAADLALVTAAPEIVGIENTRRFLRDLEAEGLAGDHLVPVLNATSLAPSVTASQAAESLDRATIWEVPFDSRVGRANQRGIQPGSAPGSSPALRSLRALAGRIAEDPARIERRQSVRAGRGRVDPAVGERLRSFFAPTPLAAPAETPEPVVYSTAPPATVYHTIPCTLGARIHSANRVTAEPTSVPLSLRPCKVCLAA
jgi:pilus assembly protein CpaE